MASEVEGRETTYWGLESKACNSCKSSSVVLFYCANSAFLCGACDARVHSANKLASRHERVWLCEVCELAPAAIMCKADAASLYLMCDADIHSANPLAHCHERLPVVPFFEFASTIVVKNHGTSSENDGVFLLEIRDDVDEEVDLKSAD